MGGAEEGRGGLDGMGGASEGGLGGSVERDSSGGGEGGLGSDDEDEAERGAEGVGNLTDRL